MALDNVSAEVASVSPFPVSPLWQHYSHVVCAIQRRNGDTLALDYPELFVGWFQQILQERTARIRINNKENTELKHHMEDTIRKFRGSLPLIKGVPTDLASLTDEARLTCVLDRITPSWRKPSEPVEQVTPLRHPSVSAYHTIDPDDIGRPEDAIRAIVLPVVMREIYSSFPDKNPDSPKHWKR